MVTLAAITLASVASYRDVRLRALLDAPLAFGSTYARESQFSDVDWARRAAQWNDGVRSAGFLAWDDEDPCGIAAGFLDEGDPAVAHLVSMWVAPTHRGRGVGRLLVTAVADWARSRDARTLRLMVTSCNDAALGFYERLGFARTGRVEPYPNDPALVEFEMARDLD